MGLRTILVLSSHEHGAVLDVIKGHTDPCPNHGVVFEVVDSLVMMRPSPEVLAIPLLMQPSLWLSHLQEESSADPYS